MVGVGSNHNQIEYNFLYLTRHWFTFHGWGEKKAKQQKHRRRSWNEHLGKTCRCIKYQHLASLWHSAKLEDTITSTTITNILPSINKGEDNSDIEERMATVTKITCQLDEGWRQQGEIQTIWDVICERPPDPWGPQLTSARLARLDLFEVLHNALNITPFSLHSISYLLLLQSCPLLSTLNPQLQKQA